MKSLFLISLLLLCALPCSAEPLGLENRPLYSLSVYGGQMTDNGINEFFDNFYELDFEDSYLVALALARRVGSYKDLISFEVEGQIVKHFEEQDHWEFNALLTARWELFPWDHYLDTSFALGTGPSYATNTPEIEVERSDESEHLLAYMLVELEFVLPSRPNVALITRIHHRSNAFGLVAEDGSSNVLAVGLKFKF
jgi:hypothetical protein